MDPFSCDSDQNKPLAVVTENVNRADRRAFSEVVSVRAALVVAGVIGALVFGTLLFRVGNDRAGSVEKAIPMANPTQTTSATTTLSKVTIDVAGAVANPGVYKLDDGSRVADALEAAGGALPEADMRQVNLAAKLRDEARVYITKIGETAPLVAMSSDATESSAGSTTENLKININSASKTELEKLNGVGPATADAIIKYRSEKGTFKTVNELQNVRGIGDAKLDAIRDQVVVS